MTKTSKITTYVDLMGGVATSAQLKAAGFLPGSIAYALKSGAIEKLTRGVYCLPDIFDDEFAAVSKRWKKCVFSHGTALYLAGLSDRVPAALEVTVPRGYNPHGLLAEYPDIIIHRVSPEMYQLGQAVVKSPSGAEVKAYAAPRAVADLITKRKKSGADPQLVKDAVAGYFKRSNADLAELARVCKALGVEQEFVMYLEVLR